MENRRLRRALVIRTPTIAKARIVLDSIETGIDFLELPPDTLDESPDVGTIPIGPGAGNKALSVNHIV